MVRRVVGVIFVGVLSLFVGAPSVEDFEPRAELSQVSVERHDMPARLLIEKINLNVAIEPVGLTDTGAMDVPRNKLNVGWLTTSQRPGEVGTAVISGHYGIKDRKKSAFDELHRLRRGDRISVQTDSGASKIFVVRELRRYPADAVVSEIFTSHDEGSHLNLITCEGEWNTDTEQYLTRLVVFTDLE